MILDIALFVGIALIVLLLWEIKKSLLWICKMISRNEEMRIYQSVWIGPTNIRVIATGNGFSVEIQEPKVSLEDAMRKTFVSLNDAFRYADEMADYFQPKENKSAISS